MVQVVVDPQVARTSSLKWRGCNSSPNSHRRGKPTARTVRMLADTELRDRSIVRPS
jgi:hypothetical protein